MKHRKEPESLDPPDHKTPVNNATTSTRPHPRHPSPQPPPHNQSKSPAVAAATKRGRSPTGTAEHTNSTSSTSSTAAKLSQHSRSEGLKRRSSISLSPPRARATPHRSHSGEGELLHADSAVEPRTRRGRVPSPTSPRELTIITTSPSPPPPPLTPPLKDSATSATANADYPAATPRKRGRPPAKQKLVVHGELTPDMEQFHRHDSPRPLPLSPVQGEDVRSAVKRYGLNVGALWADATSTPTLPGKHKNNKAATAKKHSPPPLPVPLPGHLSPIPSRNESPSPFSPDVSQRGGHALLSLPSPSTFDPTCASCAQLNNQLVAVQFKYRKYKALALHFQQDLQSMDYLTQQLHQQQQRVWKLEQQLSASPRGKPKKGDSIGAGAIVVETPLEVKPAKKGSHSPVVKVANHASDSANHAKEEETPVLTRRKSERNSPKTSAPSSPSLLRSTQAFLYNLFPSATSPILNLNRRRSGHER